MTLSPRDLVRSVHSVASLPNAVLRLSEVINSPHSSSRDIARVVSEDAGLTARLLRLVNSSFYSFPRKIETVSHAITIVGTQHLCEMALATSVGSVFDKVPQDLVDMESFWRHSIACGVLARLLAGQRREPNVERFFIAGLLHDLGCLVLYTRFGDRCCAILERCRQTGELVHQVETEHFGFNHAAVGGALLEAWNLPRSHQEAVGYHHNPALASCFPAEAATVHVADLIANALQTGTSGEQRVPPLSVEAWNVLALSESLLPALLDEADRQIGEVTRIILRDDT
jgi:HD-like signal output (HDOD) protein